MQIENWLFGPEKFPGLSRNRPYTLKRFPKSRSYPIFDGDRKEWLPSPNVARWCAPKNTDHGNGAGFSFLFAELCDISLEQEAYRSFNICRGPRYSSKREALKLCLYETLFDELRAPCVGERTRPTKGLFKNTKQQTCLVPME